MKADGSGQFFPEGGTLGCRFTELFFLFMLLSCKGIGRHPRRHFLRPVHGVRRRQRVTAQPAFKLDSPTSVPSVHFTVPTDLVKKEIRVITSISEQLYSLVRPFSPAPLSLSWQDVSVRPLNTMEESEMWWIDHWCEYFQIWEGIHERRYHFNIFALLVRLSHKRSHASDLQGALCWKSAPESVSVVNWVKT